MPDGKTKKTWLLSAAAFFVLLLGSVAFLIQHWQGAMAEARRTAEAELGLLASLVRTELQGGNYQVTGEVLNNWGASQPEVAGLRLLAANGVTIGEYLRPTPAGERLSLEAPIQYSYRGQARLILDKDLSGIRAHQNWLILEAAAALGIVAAILAVLNRLLLLYRRESASLQANETLLRQDREQQTILRSMLEDVVAGGTIEQTLDACLTRLLDVSWLSLQPRGGIFLMAEDGLSLHLRVSRDLPRELVTLCDRVPLGRCHCGRAAASRQLQFSQCVDHRHETTYPGMTEHGHYNLPLLSEGKVLGVIVLYLPPDFTRAPDKEQFLTTVADVLAGYVRRKRAEESLRHLNEELEQRVGQRTTELVAAKDEAERANLAKSEFLSRMSHELRTPLNAILGFGQLLEMENLTGEQADNVGEIVHAGNHLLELINEVLDLARIESGKLTVSLEPVPLMQLIEESLTLIRPLAEARGIRIVEAGRDCGEHVLADRVRLKQVLLNLMSNAVKYNREGGSLGIACLFDGEAIQIRVNDTGPGLAPEQQARLFIPFERLDADKAAIEGTGIGLALSKRLTELMQGEIGVASTPGVGSTFWVRLPFCGDQGEAMPAASPAEARLPDRPDDKRHGVLCIEDNPANMRLVERILARRDDIHLICASAPGLGLDLAVAHRPDLILLDINLPDMDGFDVMRCLREHEATRDTPVVAISANAMPKDLARGKAAGFTDYLTKPLNVEQLLHAVDRALAAGENEA